LKNGENFGITAQDYSAKEVINLEMENEFKKRNMHIFKLNNGEVNAETAQDLAEGYVDDEGVYHGVDQDEKLF
jgi:hypothetical protein